jgi:hypothetical protein
MTLFGVIGFLPIVPILGGLAVLFGAGTLVWYDNLTAGQKQEADRLAWEMFGRCLKQLTSDQAAQIRDYFLGR